MVMYKTFVPIVSLSYPKSYSQEVSMNINPSGIKKRRTFKRNSTKEINPNEMMYFKEDKEMLVHCCVGEYFIQECFGVLMQAIIFRSSTCKMVRTLIQRMRMLDRMPEEVHYCFPKRLN